jgi:hypothetical protein
MEVLTTDTTWPGPAAPWGSGGMWAKPWLLTMSSSKLIPSMVPLTGGALGPGSGIWFVTS